MGSLSARSAAPSEMGLNGSLGGLKASSPTDLRRGKAPAASGRALHRPSIGRSCTCAEPQHAGRGALRGGRIPAAARHLERRSGQEASDTKLRDSIQPTTATASCCATVPLRRRRALEVSCTSPTCCCARAPHGCERTTRCWSRRCRPARAPRAAQDKPRVVFVGGLLRAAAAGDAGGIDDNCYGRRRPAVGCAGSRRRAGQRRPDLGAAESFVQPPPRPVQHDERRPRKLPDGHDRGSRAEAAIVTAAKFCEPGLESRWLVQAPRPRRHPVPRAGVRGKDDLFEQMARARDLRRVPPLRTA